MNVFLRRSWNAFGRATYRATFSDLTQSTRLYAESSAVTVPGISLPQATVDPDTEENRRKFNKKTIFDLCLEKFDIDLLYFHQVMTNEEWADLIDNGFMIEKLLNMIKYDEFLKTGKLNDEMRESLAKLNVFNMRIPKKYGGKEYTETQAQYIHEILAIRPSIARMFAEHEEMVVKVLVKYGTEAQKAKYLPKLASGKITMAFAFLEESSSTLDPNSYLGLEVIQDNDMFILKGEKSWVFNAKSADTFIVIGTQTVIDDEGILKINSLFIVDKDESNVIVYQPMEKKWFRGVEICKVVFDEVTVGKECILGDYGRGFEIFLDIFKNNKTSVLAECTSVMKRLVFDASEKCHHFKIYKNDLSFDYGDYGLGELSVLTYATESLTYYLASRADYFENPDLSPEIALAKIFATETLSEAIQMYFSFVGRFSYDKNSIIEEFVQNSPYYSMLDDSIFDMKIYIMSQAIKHMAVENKENFKQLLLPLEYPLMNMKYMFTRKMPIQRDDNKPKLLLRQCVSSNVAQMADELEYCISRLSYFSENCILRHKKNSMEHDYDLLILCDVLSNIYALIACVARASKASELRTKNFLIELELCNSFARKTTVKVKNLISLIGRNHEELECSAEIGRKALTYKNYIAEHPLTRNF